MKKYLIIGATILPLAFITASGLARPGGAGQPEGFLARFDSDGDGRVTRSEIEAVRAAEFTAADSDGSDALSFAELNAHEQQQRAERQAQDFARLDQDGSGGISTQEFVDGHPQERAIAAATVFGLADSNSDGSLSLTELEALRQDPAPWHFANLDADGDGGISQDEFTSAPPPRGPGGR